MYHRWLTALGLMLLLPLAKANVVTLAWDPSGSDVAGYRVYYGGLSRVYSRSVDVGQSTSFSVSNLVAGSTYFFAVTAYNALGLESDFSSEIVYTPKLQIGGLTADENGATLTWTSPPGVVFRVLMAHLLTDPVWVDISGPILAISPTTSWTHVRTGSDSCTFYRLEMISVP